MRNREQKPFLIRPSWPKVGLLAFALCGGLAACGDTGGEQALYGAGAGAAGAALLDGNLVTGAAVGAAANLLYCAEYRHRC